MNLHLRCHVTCLLLKTEPWHGSFLDHKKSKPSKNISCPNFASQMLFLNDKEIQKVVGFWNWALVH